MNLLLQKTAQPTADCRIVRLESEADWLGARADFESLERVCPADPWLNWEYQFRQWKQCFFDQTCWMVLVDETAEFFGQDGAFSERDDCPLAGAIFREHRFRNRFLQPVGLRLFDDVDFMRIGPFLMREGAHQKACRAMVHALEPIRKQTGADLMAFYRTDMDRARPWLDALKSAGKKVKVKPVESAPQCPLGDDFDVFLQEKHPRELKDVRKQARRLKNRFGVEPVVHRVDLTDNEDQWQQRLDQWEELRRRTWQHRWEEASPQVDHHILLPRMRMALDVWRRRGLLRMYFLYVDGQPVGFWCGLICGETLWALWIGYDEALKSYSPGKTVFLESLRGCHRDGARLIELGGEADGWKAPWASRCIDVLQIETPLASILTRGLAATRAKT